MFDRAYTEHSQHLAEGFWSWDLGANVVQADSTYRDIVGITHKTALRPFHIIPLIVAEDRDRVLYSLFRTIGGQSVPAVNYRIRRPDGQSRLVIGRATVERDGRGVEQAVRGSITDITGEIEFTNRHVTESHHPNRRALVVVAGRERFARLGLVSVMSASA